ncbi:MAG: hypothetical protein KGO02_19435 [Alphaproteobacteria bacterium]|nr:hypothetical protein [Alphaproteobacteria bacterium]
MVALFHMLLEAQKVAFGTPDQILSFVSDVRLGERILAGADHAARIRRIREACRQIKNQWATIKPRKSVLKKKP